MSADFWAGYISGAAGILIGNPLDLLKVRLQASPIPVPHPPIPPVPHLPHPTSTPASPSPNTPSPPLATTSPPSLLSLRQNFQNASTLLRGASAPILSYGFLNALLFYSYNRTAAFLDPSHDPAKASDGLGNLWTTWVAGAVGGLATWVVSTPTELIKCRAQLGPATAANGGNGGRRSGSWAVAKEVVRKEGVRGLYAGGMVTALRDSIGYGFYFWSYEVCTRALTSSSSFATGSENSALENGKQGKDSGMQEAAKVLFCGGIAGVVTWLSVFPLDVLKTRVQTQVLSEASTANMRTVEGETASLLAGAGGQKRVGAWEVARRAYVQEGVGVFFRGLGVCSMRAFIVNAVQWAVYEWIMRELQPARGEKVLEPDTRKL